jgi:ribonuclease HI
MIHIFTDGSSRGNPGPGGWGMVLIDQANNRIVEQGGAEAHTTNNRMEMYAIIQGLSWAVMHKATEVTCYTDSSYTIQGATAWMHGWKKNNWKTKTGAPVLNQDLWQEIGALVESVRVQFVHVRGHQGVAGNERVDTIANTFASKERLHLYDGVIDGYSIPIASLLSTKQTVAPSKSASGKAYSYLSLVDGEIQKHITWSACEARVRGVRGARFCKTVSQADEEERIQSWTR